MGSDEHDEQATGGSDRGRTVRRRWVVTAAAAAVVVIALVVVIVRRTTSNRAAGADAATTRPVSTLPAGSGPASSTPAPATPAAATPASSAPASSAPAPSVPSAATPRTEPPPTSAAAEAGATTRLDLELPWLHEQGEPGASHDSTYDASFVTAWTSSDDPAALLVLATFPAGSPVGTSGALPVERAGPAGETWRVGAAGRSSAETARLAALVHQGSGVPYVLDDPSMTLLASLLPPPAPSTTSTNESYFTTDDGQTVVLRVGNDANQFVRATQQAAAVARVDVAGQHDAGIATTRLDGSVYVLWQAGTTWASIQVPASVAARTPEVLGAVRATTVAEQPTTTTTMLDRPGTYRAVGGVIQEPGGVAELAFTFLESLPPQGGDVPLGGFDWDDIPDRQTSVGVTWSESSYVFTGRFDGRSFVLTEAPVAVDPQDLPLIRIGNDPSCGDAELAPLRSHVAALDGTRLGILLVVDASADGRCRLVVSATFDTPELRGPRSAPLGDAVTVTAQFTRIAD